MASIIIIFSTKEGRMGDQQKLSAFLFHVSIVFVMFLLVSASQEHKKAKGGHSSKKDHNMKVFHSCIVLFLNFYQLSWYRHFVYSSPCLHFVCEATFFLWLFYV